MTDGNKLLQLVVNGVANGVANGRRTDSETSRYRSSAKAHFWEEYSPCPTKEETWCREGSKVDGIPLRTTGPSSC
jgi:hypothetical protein